MDFATARIEPIQYLDGSTTASPFAMALVEARRADLRVLDRETIRRPGCSRRSRPPSI